MSDQDRVQKLVESLTGCLAELDRMGAEIAAVHVDSALHAVQRQFGWTAKVSDPE